MLPGLKKSRFCFKDLQIYLAIILKHLRLMVLLMCLALLSGLAFYVFKRPVYHCRSLVRVESQIRVLDEESFFQDTSFNYLFRQMNSPEMLLRVAARFDLEVPDVQVLRERHLRKITYRHASKYDPDSTYYDVRVWAYSPELARNWLPVAMKEFYRYRAERRERTRREMMALWSEDMSRMREEMLKFAEKEESFKEQTQYVELQQEHQEVQGIPGALMTIERRLSQIEERRALVNDARLSLVEQLALMSRLEPRPQHGIGDLVSPDEAHTFALAQEERSHSQQAELEVDTQEAEAEAEAARAIVIVPQMIRAGSRFDWTGAEFNLRRLLQSKQVLSERYLPAHPRMRAVQQQIDGLTETLQLQLQAWNDRLNWERARLMDQQQELMQRLPQVDDIVHRYHKVMEDLKLLKYGKLPWHSHYDELQQKLAQLKVKFEYGSEAPERTQIEYFGAVSANNLPVSPNRLKLLLASFLLGGCLCVVVPFGVEYFDHTITVVESAETNLGMRGLGIVPLLPEETNGRKRFLMTDPGADESSQRSFIETFRMIRANMQTAADSAVGRKIIMITSSLPREGKTVVSANLALTFARMGRKVLIIDADTRRGTLHRTFGVNSTLGLSGLLNSDISFEDAKVATAQRNLDLLPTGPHADNVIELLASPFFARILDELRLQYDHIFIDTPPVLGLSEACELIPYVDGVLLVIWSGYTPRHQVEAAAAALAANGADFLGFVLNRVDLSKATNYYHYYYYSDYYYHSYHDMLPEKTVTTKAS